MAGNLAAFVGSDAPDADPELLAFAIDVAETAGASTLEWFQSAALEVERKGDGTPVTVADRHAERVIREMIGRRFPDDTVLGEEEGLAPGSTGRRWIVDPIDGTKAFTRGVPLYSTLLAVEDEHGPAVAVIRMPALGQTVAAGRGLGCTSNGERATVSTSTSLRGGVLTTSGFDYWPDDALAGIRHTGVQLRTWGDGYGYALVATGRVEAMVDPVANEWDLAPMPLIVAEAGGTFTSGDGDPRIDAGSGVASNGAVHAEVLAALH